MPNRILKESICTSEDINHLTWFEEALFYRLIVNCDDFGRFYGNPSIVKGKLFPLKTVTNRQIDDALNKLATAGMVIRYVSDGKPFLQLATWDKHQHKRAKYSKYPEPDPCLQLHATVSEKSRNENRESENPGNEALFREILGYLNQKLGTNYRVKSEKTRRLLEARLQEGFAFHDFQTVIDKKSDQWLNTDMEKYLRPETLFGPKFEGYLNEKGGKKSPLPMGRNYDKDFYDGVLEEAVEALKVLPSAREPEEKDPMTEPSVIENYRKYLNPSLNSFEEEWLAKKVESYGKGRVLSAMRQMLKAGERETGDLLRRLEEGA